MKNIAQFTVIVDKCIDCYFYTNTMDGPTCNELEKTLGAYKGLLKDPYIVPNNCPKLVKTS